MAAPKLRFKEFDGAWSETLFQDLFIFKNGVNASKEQYGSGIKFINVLDIINNPNGITYDSIIGSVNITSKEIDKNLVKYGDVLFQRSSETREEVGQSNVYLGKDPVVFGGFVIRGSAQKEYDPIFMNGLLKTDSLRDQITQLSGGSTRFNIGQDSLNKVSAYLPLKEEQTKIASFLSAVDEKINQLTQKHELLSYYKQGMMQKLFSQQLRFKADDGSEFGEWENYSLKELLLKVIDNRGKTPDTKPDLDIPLIEINAVGNRNVDYSKVSKFVSKDTFNSWFRAYLEDKDILFSTVGNTAICSIYSSQVQAGIAQNLVGLRARKEVVESVFLYYLLIVESNNKKFKAIEMQAVQPSIKVSQMIHINFEIPKSLTEQIKISNFLSSIDQKIEVVAQQIEQAKQWKKGLLQQMFV